MLLTAAYAHASHASTVALFLVVFAAAALYALQRRAPEDRGR